MIQHLKDKYDSGEIACEVELVLNVMGGKWKPIILWHLGEQKIMRYGEIKKAIGRITPKVLIQQLREMEQDGVIARKEYPQIPPKVEYSLTPIGEELIPIIHLLCRWGRQRILGQQEG